MTPTQIDDLISKAITDTDFRRALLADPSKTLAALGYPEDPKLIAAIHDAANSEGPQGPASMLGYVVGSTDGDPPTMG